MSKRAFCPDPQKLGLASQPDPNCYRQVIVGQFTASSFFVSSPNGANNEMHH